MLGVAISSPSSPILTNGQLLLELLGYTISDSLTTLLQRESFERIRDLLLELATASFIYAKLGYSQVIAQTHDLCTLRSGEVELLSITGAFSDWYRILGYLRSVECLGHWFDSLCVQISVTLSLKCLSALLLSAANVIFHRKFNLTPYS